MSDNSVLREQLESYTFHQTKYFFNMHKHMLLNKEDPAFSIWLNFIFHKAIEDADYQWFIVQTLTSIKTNISHFLEKPEYKLMYMTFDVCYSKDIWNQILQEAPSYPPKVRKKIYHLIENIYPYEQSQLLLHHFEHSCSSQQVL